MSSDDDLLAAFFGIAPMPDDVTEIVVHQYEPANERKESGE